MRAMRRISWVKAARKPFDAFPPEARLDGETALAIAADGRKADIAKPMKGMDGGVFEIALAHRGDAFRVVYAIQIDDGLWVIHAFQKKSRSGIEKPRSEVDLVRLRLECLREALE